MIRPTGTKHHENCNENARHYGRASCLATAIIGRIIDDEQIHHDRFLDRMDLHSPWHRALKTVVSSSIEALISMGMKLG